MPQPRRTRLSEDDYSVEDRRHGGENARVLAAEFGVTEFCIYRIRRGLDWRDA